VWIDGGLHATEDANSQALFTEAYHFLNLEDCYQLWFLTDIRLITFSVDGGMTGEDA
jgi:hypothetical protein